MKFSDSSSVGNVASFDLTSTQYIHQRMVSTEKRRKSDTRNIRISQSLELFTPFTNGKTD